MRLGLDFTEAQQETAGMGKYDPLHEKLSASRAREVRLSFNDIEALLGADLPKGAREKKSWWTKEESGHASAWLEAGYEADVDLDAQTVVYRKAAVEAPAKAAGLAHARELVDTGVDQAKDLFSSGAGQLRDAFGKAAPRAKRAAPWVVLGGVAIGLVGLLARGSSKDRA
jgi:hypothetical protein